jgi:hypothetical protein
MSRPILTSAAVALLVFVAALPDVAGAQFTGVVVRPERRAARAESTTADSGRPNARDTIAQVRLTEMKRWVDSATVALASAAPAEGAEARGAAADSSGGPPPAQAPSSVPAVERGLPPGRAAGAPAPDSTMRDGARAPDTATPLPTVALAGGALLGVGLWLRRRGARGRA